MKAANFLFLLIFLITSVSLTAQKVGEVVFDGQRLDQMIADNGDTILVAQLDDVSISSPRTFADKDEYRLYMKYRRYALVVYPYAKEAIRIFRETEEVTQNMKPNKRKKHYKRLQKELKEEFEDPLKKLTKTQGYILQKMIERETGKPMHDLVKNLRGGMTASYWSTFSRFYGYDLKSGYIVGEDHILDIVLDDFNVSHDYK